MLLFPQEYDPDLPPELAAATGVHDVLAENANSGKLDVGQSDLAKGSARVRPPIVRTAVMLFYMKICRQLYSAINFYSLFSYSSLLFLCLSNCHNIYTELLAIMVKKAVSMRQLRLFAILASGLIYFFSPPANRESNTG